MRERRDHFEDSDVQYVLRGAASWYGLAFKLVKKKVIIRSVADRNEIIMLGILPLAQQQSPNFIFIDGKTCPHCPHVVDAALHDHVISWIVLPNLQIQMYVIEHA